MDEAAFQAAKERLTSEARQLVTASKQFVRAATDSVVAEETAALAACVGLVARLAASAGDCAAHATAPLQTRNLVMKARDVAAAFRATTAAANDSALAGDSPQLLHTAEALAAALATLLRSLRVFSP